MERHLITILLALLWSGGIPAEAQVRTAITKMPFAITKPGNYYVAKDLTLTKALPADLSTAIVITTDDVDLDLNGRTLSGASFGVGATAVGLDGNAHVGITVRNGTIRNFKSGVALSPAAQTSSRFVCDHIVVEDFADTESRIGFFLLGDDTVVRSCSVRSDHDLGFALVGINCRLLDIECSGAGTAVSLAGLGAVVENSRFRDSASTTTHDGAITSPAGTISLVSGCYFQGYTSALSASGNTAGATTSCTYRDNTFVNCTAVTDNTNGATATNAGGNYP